MRASDLLLPICLTGLLAVPLAPLIGGCGAQKLDAPAPQPHPERCRSVDELAPALDDALTGGNAERLRTVIERHGLLDEQPDGSPSPVQTLIYVSLRTLKTMAADPPEAGAADGERCNNVEPPAPRDANRTCEARRIIDTFVREGKGTEALRLLDPLLAGALDYLVGKPPAAFEPHYEVAAALAATCSKAYCRTEDTLDLLTGALAFLEPTATEPDRPRVILSQLSALFSNPAIKKALDDVGSKLTEDQLVAFSDTLLSATMALPTDPDAFAAAYHRDIEIAINDLLTSLDITRESEEYGALRLALDEVIGPHEKPDASQPHGELRPLLFDLLDPARSQPVIGPLQRVLDCMRKNDPGSSMMRMLLALSYKEGVVSLGDIFGALEGLAAIDERQSLITFGRLALEMIRTDEEGTRAFRKLCSVVLETVPPTEGELSNAELVLPVAADLFEEGAVGELICVTDTLLFGCAGGTQPACADPLAP